jgi:hypothetical protein
MKEKPWTFIEPPTLFCSTGFVCFLGFERANQKSGNQPQNRVAKAWQLLNIFIGLPHHQS